MTPRSTARRPARRAAALFLAGALLPAPARAITAGDARTLSFKLQSEGMRLYKEGKFREATEAFQQVVGINLNSFLAYYYLGICLIAERRYADSIDPLKIALDLQPDYIQAHLALGDADLKQGDASEARAEYLRALDLQPNYAPAFDGLGRLFESTGQDDQAEAQYRKALEINVAFADAYTHLGDLYLRRGRLDDAIDLFLKAISVRPDFGAAYTRLGVAYARKRLYDDAIAATRKAQALAPQDPDPFVALARIDLDLENTRSAEREIQAALAIDPRNPAAHLILADLKCAAEDFEAAVELLQDLSDRGVEDSQMRRAVMEALETIRADAVRHAALRKSADRTPPDPQALADLARFLAGHGAHRRAADLLERAAGARAPGPEADASRFEAAGEALAGGLAVRAASLFGALAGPDGAADPALREAARFNLGVSFAEAGLDDRAAETFTAYLAGHPDDARAHLYLGNACLRLGRLEEARVAYAAFLDRAGSDSQAAGVRRLLESLRVPARAEDRPAVPPRGGAPAGEAP
jgi:tetratricopeptide (TPR) repeat protein